MDVWVVGFTHRIAQPYGYRTCHHCFGGLNFEGSCCLRFGGTVWVPDTLILQSLGTGYFNFTEI